MKKNLLGELFIMKEMDIKPNFSELSREYGIDRHTIKKYYENGGINRKARSGTSYYDQYRDEIKELLERPHISSRAAFEYMLKKYGDSFQGNYGGFRHYCWREDLIVKTKNRTVHPRYETPPGKQLQIDWKENISLATIKGEILNFNILTSTLGYSRLHTFVYSESKTTGDFIRCTIDTLKMIGGLPERILTDNMSAVVSVKGVSKNKHPIIEQFEKDLGIPIELCKVRTPETKGKDESANRFLNWLMAYDGKLSGKQELFDILTSINKRVNEINNQTTGLPPIKLFEKEKEHLNSLPNMLMVENYLPETKMAEVPPTLLVNYRGCSYSVPKKALGKKVKLEPTEDILYIYLNTELLAVHAITGRKINYLPDHYSEALTERIKNKTSDEIEKMAENNLKMFDELWRNDNE